MNIKTLREKLYDTKLMSLITRKNEFQKNVENRYHSHKKIWAEFFSIVITTAISSGIAYTVTKNVTDKFEMAALTGFIAFIGSILIVSIRNFYIMDKTKKV